MRLRSLRARFERLNALWLATLVIDTSGTLPRSLHIIACDNTKRLRKGAATNRSIPLLSARRFASFPDEAEMAMQRDLVIPAKAGQPVRRGFSIQSLLPLVYWIVRLRGR